MLNNQIKSEDRVYKYGEVYTNDREIEAMLGLIPSEMLEVNKTFLEPTCGTGNFLDAILKKKLTKIRNIYLVSELEYKKQIVMIFCSLYGIDILNDNVEETRNRLLLTAKIEYCKVTGNQMDNELAKNISFVLLKNIICGNSLSGLDCNRLMKISEWNMSASGILYRTEQDFIDISKEVKKTKKVKYYWFSKKRCLN